MRVLVVGTVPPPGGAAAQVLGRIAAERVAEGDDVEVLSPDLRSAAHRNSRLSGLWLAIQLARAAHRFDELIVRVQPSVPLPPEAGRVFRAISLMAFGAVLRLYKKVTLRLDSPVPLPGGLGGRSTRDLWSHAQRIVVGNEEDAKNLRLVPGVDADRVVVEEIAGGEQSVHFDGWDVDPGGNLREEIMLHVRERAGRDRLAQVARASLGAEGTLPLLGASFGDAQPPSHSVIEFVRFGMAQGASTRYQVGQSPKELTERAS